MLPWRNTLERFGILHMLLHWGMAVIIIGMLGLGLYMTSLKFSPETLKLYGLHKSIGAVVLVLACIRVMWRLMNIIPPLPSLMPKWEKLAANASHILLYALMFAMPLSGWLMSSATGFPVSVFGLFTLPNLILPDPEMRKFYAETHELLAWALIAVITLHAMAALKHHFIDRDNVLRRMLPSSISISAENP